MKLTKDSASGLQLPAGKTDHVVFDDDLPGFGIRLREGGSRSWIFQYKLGAKNRRMSLGSATAIPVDKARKAASELHARVRLGQDPAAQKAENRQQAAETFSAVATTYLTIRRRDLRPGGYDQVDRHLQKYCKPLHGLPLNNVTQRAVATRLNELRDIAGNIQANRTRASLHAFFRWAMQQGIVTNNPVANTGRFEEKSRERVLTDDELREIWKAAGVDHYGSIVKLLMLTGQRAEEIAGLRRSELRKVDVPKSRINVELPAFTIDAIDLPSDRTKNQRPHIVPLSPSALAIIEAQPQRVGDDGELRNFVFGVGNRGFSGWSKSKERIDQRMLEARVKAWQDAGRKGPKPGPMAHWVHHDLRRTLDTVMNDRLGIAPHVVEAVINHVSGHKSGKAGVAGVYNKAVYLRERIEALRLWGDHIMALVGEKGVSLQAAE